MYCLLFTYQLSHEKYPYPIPLYWPVRTYSCYGSVHPTFSPVQLLQPINRGIFSRSIGIFGTTHFVSWFFNGLVEGNICRKHPLLVKAMWFSAGFPSNPCINSINWFSSRAALLLPRFFQLCPRGALRGFREARFGRAALAMAMTGDLVFWNHTG